MGLRQLSALLIQLEFPTWKLARPWTYSGSFAIQDGLSRLGVECFTIPAIPGEQRSWLSYARSFCQNKKFDQVWIWLVHYPYDEATLDWIGRLAPVRIGVLMESMRYSPETYVAAPHLAKRPEVIHRQIKSLTHVLTYDENDADELNAQQAVQALWWPPAVPTQCISQEPAFSQRKSKAVFHGNAYGSRRWWLDHPFLKDRIVAQKKDASESKFHRLFDELQQDSRDKLLSGRMVSEQDLVQYVLNLRNIRNGEFIEWMGALRRSGPIVNLPSYASFYGGRVFEGMAAGCPAISFNITNRPKTQALFEDGKEILLFPEDDPSSLVQHLERLDRDPVFSRKMAVQALRKINEFHTTEWRVQQTLDWVKNGKIPEYGMNTISEKLSVYTEDGSISCASKDPCMLSDPQKGRNMNKYLPTGYVERGSHAQYLDAPGDLIYQPHVYALAGFLAERSGVQWIVDIGCGAGQKLQTLSKRFSILGIDCSSALNIAKDAIPQGKFIEFDLEHGLPLIPEDILRDSVVVCSDVIEHLREPQQLMQGLVGVSKIAPFLLISTPDRDRVRGWLDNGPPGNPAHVMEWAATEFARFMKEAGFDDVPFLGHTVNTDIHLAKTTLLALSGTHCFYPSPANESFRVAAIIHAYNEADILPEVIDHLHEEGIEVHIFDNWSTDGSWELICALKDSGKISNAERFPNSQTHEYQWQRQLEKTAEYAATLDVDWVMHHDADEIRVSPWPGAALKDSLAHIDALGYNAIDFTVLDFRFQANHSSASAPYQVNLTHCEFGRRPGHFQQIKAWKNVGRVQLANSGGHEAQFDGRRIYPVKFLMKHYPLRNVAQAQKKVFHDRLPRVEKEQETLGWHRQYDKFIQQDIGGWETKDLIPFYRPFFETEYLVERMSGVGLETITCELVEEERKESMQSILKNYSHDAQSKVWHRPGYDGIAYNDGDENELRLKKIIDEAHDLSVMSLELAGQCSDWPTRYHLSRQRSNLLRPFEAQLQDKKILEIGAGCGAITRYLGESGAEVLALEGSARRASIAASRCRDLRNVTVVAEVIHEFSSVPCFDVVTLIGVLEYARKFFPGEGNDPVDAMLCYVKRFLKPGGQLFLAIENQLGLKYFAGFPEDHMGQSMFGVEDYYGSHNVVTFGRKDLLGRVQNAGLTEMQWWYPFPDYKLPSLLIADEGTVPREDMDLFPIVRNACSQDPQYPMRVTFNQERAWRPVMRNGLLRDMANSFMVIASDKEIPEPPTRLEAIHFATNRRPEYSKKVLFSRNDAGAPITHQIPLYPQAIPRPDALVKLRLEHQAFLQGLLWQERLVDILTTPGWKFEQVQQWFQVWIQEFGRVVGLTDISKMQGTKISGRYIDLLPRNMIIDQKGVTHFIDQEWEYLEELDLSYVIFRALNTSIGELNIVSRAEDNENIQVFSLMKKVAASVGFSFTNSDIEYFHKLENNFQKNAVGLHLPPYDEWVKKVFRVGDIQNSNNNVLIERERQLVQLLDVITERNEQIVHLTRSLQESGAEISSTNTPQPVSPSGQDIFDCSIIIPVFNKLELTQQCLIHLAEVTQENSYEVVIVDNHSSDGTSEFLRTLDGDIQVIANPENLGFAKACNQGAQAARGKHLVFLNNDTIPQAGWLSELVKEIEQNENVDVVGSKLLYEDKTIQHAGVVFSRLYQTPYHIFQGLPESFPPANVRKEFQVVTAACMLVRKETFESVGGFDEGFVNGFEDVDLCLKIRQLGKKVIYQPKSCLYHLESQSPGRKIHDVANAKRLLSRWGHLWFIDEDIVAAESGYFMQQYVADDKLRSRLVPKQEIENPATWQHVAKLQQLLLGQQCQPLKDLPERQKIEELVSYTDGWPSDLGILEWVGRVCETLRCETEAKRFWEKLLSIGDHPNARLGLARAYIKTGDLQKAQKHLDVLKTEFSPKEEGWTLQGVLCMQNQDFSLAKRAFELALEFDQTSQKARLGVGMACMGLEANEEAMTQFSHVLSQDPDNLEAIRCLLQVGTVLQRWDILACHLTCFVERNPAEYEIRFALAGVAIRAGHIEKAREQLSWFQLIKPDYEGLDDLASVLNRAQLQEQITSAL